MSPNVIIYFLAILVIDDSDGNEENDEECSLPTKVSKVSKRSLLRVAHD